MASETKTYRIETPDGHVVTFDGYVRRVGASGTRYGKPRLAPKPPRKLKKAIQRATAEIVMHPERR